MKNSAQDNFNVVTTYLKWFIAIFVMAIILMMGNEANGQSSPTTSVMDEDQLVRQIWVEVVEANDENLDDVDLIYIGDSILLPDGGKIAEEGDYLWLYAEHLVEHYALQHRLEEWVAEGKPLDLSLFLAQTLPENAITFTPDSSGTPAESAQTTESKIEGVPGARYSRAEILLGLVLLVCVILIMWISTLRSNESGAWKTLSAERTRHSDLQKTHLDVTERMQKAEIEARHQEDLKKEAEVEVSKTQRRLKHFLQNPPETHKHTLPSDWVECGWDTCLTSNEVEEHVNSRLDGHTVCSVEKVYVSNLTGTAIISLNLPNSTEKFAILDSIPAWRVWVETTEGQEDDMLFTGAGMLPIDSMLSRELTMKPAGNKWDKRVMAATPKTAGNDGAVISDEIEVSVNP